MSNKRKGILTTDSEWRKHLRKIGKRFFWKGERLAEKKMINLIGEFTSDFEFRMKPKWQSVVIQNFEREVSYLNGQIFSDEFKRTRVTFTVRPNSILLIFFFVFPLFGILALTTNNIKGNTPEFLIVGLAFTFVVPALMLVFGHFAKQGIKNRFIKTFNLKAIE